MNNGSKATEPQARELDRGHYVLIFICLMVLTLVALSIVDAITNAARADVTVTTSNFRPRDSSTTVNPDETFFLEVTSTDTPSTPPPSVKIVLSGTALFDQCMLPTWGTPTGVQPTTPDLGPNNNDARSQDITVTPPFKCDVELDSTDGNDNWQGATAALSTSSTPSTPPAPIQLVKNGTATITTEPKYTVRLRWTAPQLNEDDTPYTDPKGYRVIVGSSSGLADKGQVVVNDPASRGVNVLLPKGMYFFVVRAVNSKDLESANSNEIQGIADARPAPPSELDTVPDPTQTLKTKGGSVYALLVTHNSLIVSEVGSIPANVECDTSQFLNSWGGRPVDSTTLVLVPVESAQLFGDAEPEAVFAECTP